ncbi:phage antirepressor KilAC domain-containing protein [Edaphobacter modestus]|uniref:Phage antirepressor YoqD-like protein n=1 Tax=Edaphobacter modestus TaxID=388466 RepID=A0A4Q7YPL1_9BACT|nr:phage antirepressor KilAC domain-containing protein [Edaphobacter modestus]RZU39338.1 phage antirepressor YoqD-like protein [Edaphobacter modestus]
MSEIVKIGSTSVSVLEINGQRMVTLAMIDDVHGRPEGTAKRNFIENRYRFIEGEDYINSTRNEVRTVVPDAISQLGNPNVILLSESGYLLLAKSLNDDRAWQVQRQLVNVYFKAKSDLPVQPVLPDLNDSSVLQQLILKQCEKNLYLQAEVKKLETAVVQKDEQLQLAAPKLEFINKVTDSTNLLSVAEAAKLLRWGQKKLFAKLRAMKILQFDNQPYQRFLDANYFQVKLGTRPGSNGEPITYWTTKVTGKGLCWLHKTLQEAL